MSDFINVANTKPEGWGWLTNSPKWHYFQDGRSLCGRWFTFSKNFEDGNETSPDNCKSCVTKKQKAEAKNPAK